MATIRNLKPDQIVYSIVRQKMGNTTVTRGALMTVRIVSIDPEGMFVMASVNGNTPRKYFERSVSKWKVNKPEPKSSRFGLPNY